LGRHPLGKRTASNRELARDDVQILMEKKKRVSAKIGAEGRVDTLSLKPNKELRTDPQGGKQPARKTSEPRMGEGTTNLKR